MTLRTYGRELRNQTLTLVRDPVLLTLVLVIGGSLALFILFPLVRVIKESLWYRGEFNPVYLIKFFQKRYYWQSLVHSLTVAGLVRV